MSLSDRIAAQGGAVASVSRAVQAVEAAVETMENTPIFNAGTGSSLTADGRVRFEHGLPAAPHTSHLHCSHLPFLPFFPSCPPPSLASALPPLFQVEMDAFISTYHTHTHRHLHLNS